MLVALCQSHQVPGIGAFRKIPNFVRFTIKLQDLIMLQLFLKEK